MKVAIIGAGASGLASLKECLDEGIEPIVFEKEEYIGGLWKYSEKIGKGGTVYRSTIINTSKEIMGFSDFPVPKDFAPFMHNRSVIEYFELYAKKFKLHQYIQFKTYVHDIRPAEDYIKSGRWNVTISHTEGTTTTRTTQTFDSVMICSGHHWDPRMPSFKGMDVFKGKQLHSHDYKDHQGFENDRVVVVGIGNSAVDVACELSHHCSQVYLSTRRGAWIFPRIGFGGTPFDFQFNRFVNMIPISIMKIILEKYLNSRFDHDKYGLRPTHHTLAQQQTISDELPVRIVCGSIKIKDDITCIGEHDIKFADGSTETNIDTIVYGTGYKFGFPFMDSSIIEVKDNTCNLYKYIFPPDHMHATLAMVGFIQPTGGAIMPMAEMQARWITQVFTKKCQLPSQAEMLADIEKKRREIADIYVKSPRHTMQVDYLEFMDELADLIGCKPNFLSIAFTDPKLALRCIFGPCTPSQFRLCGPHPWDGAKEAIRDTDRNFTAAIRTRQLKQTVEHKNRKVLMLLLEAAIIPIAYLCYLKGDTIKANIIDAGK
ncbi:uncharacterized protein TRIADDRAFT_51000 [Trichoplax adhaerens]|uniref:Flavin-containing monooxygenase n=1 Tax=Trichoplax adhaerens TaxID=10228 RepID=B3SA71_TRIAD|nr:hypothetical protein TRIADDRAFT_51000 [Trichoplax adhaerens]EDV20464.1 hypothetical protein TRIADDRAFT_51000 [Trichoplax adhaerens]|eukprot:XP_002117158.1 hypothetical protein TRIADDRAFT_51000 [Trichoplax adhaerens]